MRAQRDAIIKINYVLVEQANAATRYGAAYGLGLVCAMQSEKGITTVAVKIKRTGAKRVIRPAAHAAGIFPIARDRCDHAGSRRPLWPFFLAPDSCAATKIEGFGAPDADAVAHCPAARARAKQLPDVRGWGRPCWRRLPGQ